MDKNDTTPPVLTPEEVSAQMRAADEKVAFAIARFFDTYPLYYYILSSCARVRSASCPSIGVGFDAQNVVHLIYNPMWINERSTMELEHTLNHECQHLGLGHLRRINGRDPMLANIAMDVLVNFNIPNYKRDCPEFYARLMTVDEPSIAEVLKGKGDVRDMTYEEVYDLLKPEYDKAKEKFKQMLKDAEAVSGSHGEWGEGQGVQLTPAEEAALDGVLRDAAKKLGGRDPGNIPGAMRREIERLTKVEYNWRTALSVFAQSIATEERDPTWRRPSRRFGIQAPGHRKNFRPRLLVAVDNSGSISAEIYNLFMGHLELIAETCEEIKVIGCDTRVNFEGVAKKGQTPKFEDLQSGGGTSFQPVFDYAKKGEYDGIIYFTDGYAFDNWKTHGVATIFALCPGAREIPGHRNIKITEDK